MHSRILLILLFAFIIIFITVFTAHIYSKEFNLSSHHSKNLMVALLFAPLAFMASLIADRTAKWGMGPKLYTIINTIAGLFFFAFLGAVILGLLMLITNTTNIAFPSPLANIILGTAVALGLLGVVQSRYFKVVERTVVLPNAPLSWHGKKAVLVSDTHFGLVNHKKFSDRIVQKIIALEPSFVLHGGDFYDGPKVKMEPLTESWRALTDRVPVFYTSGNHESYGDYHAFIDSIRAAGITVLLDEKTIHDGVQIAGMTYREGQKSAEADEAITKLALDPTTPSILINHPPTSLLAAKNAGVNLMVSGHTHNGQFWPLTYVVRKVYGKYHYGHTSYETMDTITSSGVGTWGPAIRLFNTPELVVINFKTS